VTRRQQEFDRLRAAGHALPESVRLSWVSDPNPGKEKERWVFADGTVCLGRLEAESFIAAHKLAEEDDE
jgi:hypothetical protein